MEYYDIVMIVVNVLNVIAMNRVMDMNVQVVQNVPSTWNKPKPDLLLTGIGFSVCPERGAERTPARRSAERSALRTTPERNKH